MVELLTALALVLGLLWWQTGRSPFWWTAWAACACEAWRIEVIRCAALAVRSFFRHYPATFRAVRSEFGGQ